MVKALYFCLFLPVTLLAGLCTDTKRNFKYVCIGDFVDVFQNITSTSLKEQITLYKSFAGKQEAMAVWVMQNFSNTGTIHDSYKQKVSLENETILLQDFQASDEATYVMLYNNSSKRKDIDLCALYPPTLRCKPSIKHKENFRIASLDNPEYCGKPSASVRWMEYPAISYRNKTTIELLPGKEAGNYSACIEGKVIQCVKNSEWVSCKNFTLGSTSGNNSLSISDIPQWKTTNDAVFVIVSLVLSIVVAILIIVIILLWKHFEVRPKNHASVGTKKTVREQHQFQEVAGQYDDETGDLNPESEPLASNENIALQRMTNEPDQP